jgi:hypothetical protein
MSDLDEVIILKNEQRSLNEEQMIQKAQIDSLQDMMAAVLDSR